MTQIPLWKFGPAEILLFVSAIIALLSGVGLYIRFRRRHRLGTDGAALDAKLFGFTFFAIAVVFLMMSLLSANIYARMADGTKILQQQGFIVKAVSMTTIHHTATLRIGTCAIEFALANSNKHPVPYIKTAAGRTTLTPALFISKYGAQCSK